MDNNMDVNLTPAEIEMFKDFLYNKLSRQRDSLNKLEVENWPWTTSEKIKININSTLSTLDKLNHNL